MEICAPERCTGCFACLNACTTGAIAVCEDAMGRTVPKIDERKCVKCGLCRAVCPEVNRPKLSRAPHAIAAWSRSDADRAKSSSGGAAAVFAGEVIRGGGIAVGCASMDGRARHIIIDNETDIAKLRGSKYVQSDGGDVYRKIRAALGSGREALFIGMPCQVAGLRAFLRGKEDGLITVDLICHGTPPARYLAEHINAVAPGKRVTSFAFRGERDWKLTLFDGDDVICSRGRARDAYFAAFLGGLTFRSNCYGCPYKRPERAGDLTVGDFWGIDRRTLKNPYGGRISLVLPNTEKGAAFLERCKPELIWEARRFDEAANSKQGDLIAPGKPPKGRAAFEACYPEMGFERAVRKAGVRREMLQLMADEVCYAMHIK